MFIMGGIEMFLENVKMIRLNDTFAMIGMLLIGLWIIYYITKWAQTNHVNDTQIADVSRYEESSSHTSDDRPFWSPAAYPFFR